MFEQKVGEGADACMSSPSLVPNLPDAEIYAARVSLQVERRPKKEPHWVHHRRKCFGYRGAPWFARQ